MWDLAITFKLLTTELKKKGDPYNTSKIRYTESAAPSLTYVTASLQCFRRIGVRTVNTFSA